MSVIKVIVSDDDPVMNDSISDQLESFGMKVVGKAYDGEEAFQLFSMHKPAVILVDLNMPNYDGHYAITKIKQEHPTAKIIVISGFLDKSFPVDKVSAVFSKPYNITELTNKIIEITNL